MSRDSSCRERLLLRRAWKQEGSHVSPHAETPPHSQSRQLANWEGSFWEGQALCSGEAGQQGAVGFLDGETLPGSREALLVHVLHFAQSKPCMGNRCKKNHSRLAQQSRKAGRAQGRMQGQLLCREPLRGQREGQPAQPSVTFTPKGNLTDTGRMGRGLWVQCERVWVREHTLISHPGIQGSRARWITLRAAEGTQGCHFQETAGMEGGANGAVAS